MDLGIVGTKALLIPTPGQIEQEYLGEYHNKLGTFYAVKQDEVQLKEDIAKIKKTTGITRPCNVEKTIENILDILYQK